jgi:3-oxoacyl-[acyl-carrier-protein] synthase-1
MRAHIAKFDELPYHDKRDAPIIGAAVPGLDPNLKRGQRLVELLNLALVDCLGEKPALPQGEIPLLVGLAEAKRPAGGAALADSIVKAMEAKLAFRFHPTLSRAFPKGHTAGFEALRAARELLQNAKVPACVVCGVDSYINASSLLWLEQLWRLKTEDNSDGVIPGEAAAAIVVQRPGTKRGEASVRVMGLGFAHEKAGVLSEEPLLGLGLAEAGRAALAEARKGIHDMDFRLADVTGESYGFREQALLIARLMRVRREQFPLWHCADAIGDTGAAAGPCHLVVAFEALNKGYAPGGHAIACCSAVPGDRAVAVLEHVEA